MTFGEKILKFRKELGLTQNELAEKLFLSYQAISQWENGITKPDIDMLPKLAEVFGKSIDEFFYDEVHSNFKVKNYAEDKLYIVVAKGKDLLKVIDYDKNNNVNDNIEIKIEGDAIDIQSNFSVSISGKVEGDVTAGNNVSCGGVNSGVTAGNNVSCGGVNGNITAGYNVSCGGVNGSLTAGNDISCGDIIGGNINSGNNIDCGSIKGNVTASGDIYCDTIEADKIEVEGDLIYNGKINNNDGSDIKNSNKKIVIKN